MRRKAVLYDVPERPVQIEGPDAVAFMERIFTRPISDLREGRGRYAIACTPSGGVFMDSVLFKLSEGKFWYVQPDGALETWLIAHSEGIDVTISDPGSRVLQIQGPNSLEIMRAASGGQIYENTRYFHSGFFNLGGQNLYVSPTGWTGEIGFEIYSQGGGTDQGACGTICLRPAHPMAWYLAASAPWKYGGLKCETVPDMNYEILDGQHIVGYATGGLGRPTCGAALAMSGSTNLMNGLAGLCR